MDQIVAVNAQKEFSLLQKPAQVTLHSVFLPSPPKLLGPKPTSRVEVKPLPLSYKAASFAPKGKKGWASFNNVAETAQSENEENAPPQLSNNFNSSSGSDKNVAGDVKKKCFAVENVSAEMLKLALPSYKRVV